MQFVEQLIRRDDIDEAVLTGSAPETSNWLFAPGPRSWTISCKAATEFISILDSLNEPSHHRIVLREKPEELAIEGKARREAGSFLIGLERAWKEQDDGSEVRETTLKVNGTVGVRLTPSQSDWNAYAFAQYNLDKLRSRPASTLAPGSRRDENDTNVLSLGLTSDYYAGDGSGGSVWITGQAAFVRDFANRSSRIRGAGTAEPGLNMDLGICRLGSARFFDKSQVLGARCLLQLDSELGVWLDKGLSTATSYDDFAAIGPRGSFEAFYRTGDSSELLGAVTYRYLPMVIGDLDDIERLEISLKHRFWAKAGFGVDIGFDYKNGTNPLSLEDEKTLGLSLGLIH